MRIWLSARMGMVLVAVATLSFAVYLGGCDSTKPTDPTQPEQKDYRVWIRTDNDSTLYAYHTLTGDIDTVAMPWELDGSDITVSHDGRLLYVPSDLTVRVYDIASGQGINELPYFAGIPVVVSPDGRHIAIIGDSVRILQTADYSEIYMDTTPVLHGCFSANGQNLYTVSGNVVKISLSDPAHVTVDTLLQNSELTQAIPTPDESRLLLYETVRQYASGFSVYDVASDSIVVGDYQTPGRGRLAMTPDGRYVYYGNPGSDTLTRPPLSEFTEFDILANRVYQRISTLHFTGDSEPDFMPIGEIAISPDGRWLVGMEGGRSSGGLLKYDLTEEELVDYHDFNNLTLGISIQLIP